MKPYKGTFIPIALALAALFFGCSDKSASIETGGGESPIATATAVGIDKCHDCHADTAVGGVGIFAAWGGSRHANLDNSYDAWDNLVNLQSRWWHGDRPGYDAAEQAECGVCHNPNDDALNLAFYVGSGAGTAPRFVVGCEGCHGGGSLHFGVGPIGGPKLGVYARAATAGQSSQYNTCTGCHNDTEHTTSNHRLIGDTHFDNANRAIGSNIQGYVIRKDAGSACVDCHNPHSAGITANGATGSPNVQWKSSAHGDFAGEGWKHYQWTAANRLSCQRCHTTTGLINFLAGPTTYDPTKNVFSWLGDPATDNRSEMLYCYGCHTNYYGGLRDPGPVTATYTGVTPEPVFPDVKGSNICLACHTGRESGETIKAATDNFGNKSFINSHYLTGGATLFGVSGYEYASLDYTNVTNFSHDEISTTAQPGTGSNGPCVGCHMSSSLNPADPGQGKHKFLNVGLDNTGSGEIITTAVCTTCHTGAFAMTITELNATENAALLGLSVLDNALRARGYFFANTHPYFFKTTDNTASANAVKDWSKRYDGTAGDNAVGKQNMGAAFNYNLFAHDPGFFVHNYVYSKRLVYDSIDWLDDNQFNNSVQAYVTAAYGAGSATETAAFGYFGASGRP
jgi:nitrate reductase cytochrome c-type subunit